MKKPLFSLRSPVQILWLESSPTCVPKMFAHGRAKICNQLATFEAARRTSSPRFEKRRQLGFSIFEESTVVQAR